MFVATPVATVRAFDRPFFYALNLLSVPFLSRAMFS